MSEYIDRVYIWLASTIKQWVRQNRLSHFIKRFWRVTLTYGMFASQMEAKNKTYGKLAAGNFKHCCETGIPGWLTNGKDISSNI